MCAEGNARKKGAGTASPDLLWEIIDNVDEGVMVLDVNRRVVLFSPGCERLSGWSAQQALGKTCGAIFKCLNHRGQRIFEPNCPGQQAIESCANRTGAELIITHRNGRGIWIEASYSPIRDTHGRVKNVIMVLRDVSSRKETDLMQSAILSTVSHELRTPLTTMRGMSELLMMHDFAPEESRELIENIHAESLRLERLIGDMLDVSKIDSGNVTCERVPISVAKTVNECIDLFRLNDIGHSFHVSVPSNLPMVMADAQHLRRIFDNLISNAVKYSPGGVQIGVYAEDANRKLIVNVTDKGMGIPPEHVSRIFEKFYRVSSLDSRKAEGLGLGLYIVKSLVEMNGGQIWVDSAVGRGSTFTFTLLRA